MGQMNYSALVTIKLSSSVIAVLASTYKVDVTRIGRVLMEVMNLIVPQNVRARSTNVRTVGACGLGSSARIDVKISGVMDTRIAQITAMK